MSLQDTIGNNHFILIRPVTTGHCFLRGTCTLGHPEWTKDIHNAKLFSAEEGVQKQLELMNQGFIIFVDNYYKYIPISEL